MKNYNAAVKLTMVNMQSIIRQVHDELWDQWFLIVDNRSLVELYFSLTQPSMDNRVVKC